MKKSVSLFNDEATEKKQIKNLTSNFFLKPQYFSKFTVETLFYIFYYMPRDHLQLYAAEELYRRKWRYNTDYSVWFTQDLGNSEKDNSEKAEKSEKSNSEVYYYFNPNEWKTMKYIYGPLNPKAFLSENEMFKYSKQDK
jgi:CCR4-NOT transcriptional regulation complex NOT5 subunit